MVVVGAGWIGAEVAASARQRGLDVTVIEPASVPLERVLGAEIGAIYRDIHTDHGVRMLTGTGVEAFEGDGAVERVRTSDGRALDCDFVVVGVGVQPRTALAARGRPRRRATASSSTSGCGPARPACSPPATSPTRTIPSTASRSASSTGPTRSTRAPAAARSMLGQSDALRSPAVLLLRPVRRRHGVLRLRPRLRPGRRSAAIPRRASSSPSGSFDDRVVAGMNVNVWDVTDADQATHPRARGGRRPRTSPTPTCRSTSSPARRGDAPHESPPSSSRRRRLDLARHALARAAGQRRVRPADRGLRGHGGDLEPDDLREGDHRLPRATTTSCAPRSPQGTRRRAGAVLRARARRHPPCRRHAARRLRRQRRPRRLHLLRVHARSRRRHRRRRSSRRLELWDAHRPAQRDDQGARHRGGDPRDRGAHRPRRQREHHAAVLASRATSR